MEKPPGDLLSMLSISSLDDRLLDETVDAVSRGQSKDPTMETIYVLLASVITLLALHHGEIAANHRR